MLAPLGACCRRRRSRWVVGVLWELVWGVFVFSAGFPAVGQAGAAGHSFAAVGGMKRCDIPVGGVNLECSRFY